MSDSLRQAERIAKLNTTLGTDKLALVSFQCKEGINEKFEIIVEAISKDKDINFDDAIGKNCTITVEKGGSEQRHFDGILFETQYLGERLDQHGYRLVLRPWLWLASFRRNSFIFHDKTVQNIIREILEKHSSSFSFNLSRSYPQLEYCVQYRESDMDFVCRLMEEYGINYYFRHSEGSHELVLTDEMSTFEHIVGGSRKFIPTPGRHAEEEENFFAWVPERRFTSGKIKLDDYDFKRPDTDLVVRQEVSPPFKPILEVYDSPGRYEKSSDGDQIATAWRDMERAKDGHFHARGDCVTCFPGALMTLEDTRDGGSYGGEYLALRCAHKFTDQSYRSGHEGGAGYEGSYEFIKTDKPYAPAHVTPKAVIQGPQTAKVVGERGSGSENDIDVDKWGRILVCFHWDQEKNLSRRCRVAQVWSGATWGGIYTPRIGMEVVVQFLEGDPDQPLVIGTVYNNTHMPPFDLDNNNINKTISGVKSSSTPGSGSGYNELVFDDNAGKELIRMQAERDRETLIKHDETRTVKGDRKTTIGETTSGGNDTLNVTQVLKIDAGTKIEITCGQSKITMTPENISIESLNISIKGTAQLSTKGGIVDHGADGTMKIHGAMVMIN